MPTYDYVCEKCGYEFEAFQNITEDPLKVCPKCKGYVKRQIGTGAGLIFKGSGFYITDYKKSKTSPATSSSEKKETKDNATTKTSSKDKK